MIFFFYYYIIWKSSLFQFVIKACYKRQKCRVWFFFYQLSFDALRVYLKWECLVPDTDSFCVFFTFCHNINGLRTAVRKFYWTIKINLKRLKLWTSNYSACIIKVIKNSAYPCLIESKIWLTKIWLKLAV